MDPKLAALLNRAKKPEEIKKLKVGAEKPLVDTARPPPPAQEQIGMGEETFERELASLERQLGPEEPQPDEDLGARIRIRPKPEERLKVIQPEEPQPDEDLGARIRLRPKADEPRDSKPSAEDKPTQDVGSILAQVSQMLDKAVAPLLQKISSLEVQLTNLVTHKQLEEQTSALAAAFDTALSERPAGVTEDQLAETIDGLVQAFDTALEERPVGITEDAIQPLREGLNRLNTQINDGEDSLSAQVDAVGEVLEIFDQRLSNTVTRDELTKADEALAGHISSATAPLSEGIQRLDEKVNQQAELAVKTVGTLNKLTDAVDDTYKVLKNVNNALETIAGPDFEAAGACAQIRIAATKTLIVAYLVEDNKDAINAMKEQFGSRTVNGILSEVTSDDVLVKQELAKIHGKTVAELNAPKLDSRTTQIKEWVDQTAQLVMERAKTLTKGDV
ncbi:hypothetical protein KKB44_03540 [Candidatus Micrarchaeota archaeon]|nr:hypothetical protein [Candidatus Micrarchaeota archaeon]